MRGDWPDGALAVGNERSGRVHVSLGALEQDHWGMANILRAADRRIGIRWLETLRKRMGNFAA